MPEAKRPESKRRSPASRPGKAGDSVRGGRATKPSAKPSTPAPHASRKTTRTPHEHIVEPIKRAITESVEKRSEQRLGFTARRAAILAAVVCVLTLTIARPVRTYFAQRAEMEQLAATEAMLRRQIADLEEQQVKLADPAYIAAQARERLGFVMPGDIPFQVRLKRMYPGAHYRATTATVQVPIPRAGGLGAPRIRDVELVQMVADLITALAGKPRQHIGITNPSPPGEDGRGRNTTIKERQP